MSEPEFDPVKITQDLVRCPSVTPAEAGALDYLEDILANAGFRCKRLPFFEAGSPEVDNLYARFGSGSPHLCFAGHTDVVPSGDENLWSYPPFAAEISDGKLYGRGVADMKGGIACFLAATLGFLKKRNGQFPGSISFLITGDEEGPAINGTAKILGWLRIREETIDHCLVGEPTNPGYLGQEIKIGRRGSLNGVLTVSGKRGHVAYPALAQNPIDGLLAVLQAFLSKPLDKGTDFFAPSNLEVTSIDVGNPAENVIPERATAMFNIRFNNLHTAESLMADLRNTAGEVLEKMYLTHEFRFRSSGESFLTEPGILTEILSQSVQDVVHKKPRLTTGGGTSDARFIKDDCPVVEFGLSNETIHQVDERVPVKDLNDLARIYGRFIERYFDRLAPK